MTTKKLSRNVSLGLITRTALTIFSAMLLLQLPACVEEQITPPDNETTITFSVDIPKEFTPSSYGLTGTQEDYLSTVDVLLFNSSGNYVSGPHYGIIDGTNKKVSVRIPSTNGTFTMAVFGNCRSTLNKTFSGAKETIYSGLTINKSTWGTGVSGNPAVPNEPIPMWGEASVTVANGTVSGGGNVSVDLIRMLARINVANKTAANTFTLTSVNLYNRNTYGRISPKSGDASVWNATDKVAKLPSLPGTVGATQGPLAFSPNNVTGPNGTYNGEIYTFEADIKTQSDMSKKPCLVIGGKYNQGSTYYYRIDLVDANGNYLDLLRNHTYDISINQIGGAGYSDAATAFASRPVNITYTVSSWNNGQVGGIVTDGQYSLSVSAPTLNFDATERTTNSEDNTLTINCNYGTSVTISSISSTGSWLSVRNSGGTALSNGNSISLSGNQATLRLVFGDNFGSGKNTRNGSFVLTAGRMSYTVNVEQSNELPVGILMPESNCYIVPPRGAILIPVSRANATPEEVLGIQLNSTDVFTAELVWTDNLNGVAPNSNIKTIAPVGVGSGGYVYVETGIAEGNAVVAIKNEAGNILWSWHIWVLESSNHPKPIGETPAGLKFMDRNLGATSAAQNGGVPTFGLLYQWGRKDPFPGASTLSGQSATPIYNSLGGSVSIAVTNISGTGETNNLVNSVRNPTTTYFNTTYVDWYTTDSSTKNDNLWGGYDTPTTKTVYDPCPPNWRVPRSTHVITVEWSSPWNGMTAERYSAGELTSGIWRENFGGWYPAAGRQYYNATTIEAVGQVAYNWSASPNSTTNKTYSLAFNYNGFFYGSDMASTRSNGLPVRCVQE